MSLNICLFGPQGSGKGTQAELLNKEFKIPIITPGTIFRRHIKEGTELGVQIEGIINAGQLVPNEIINRIIANRLNESDCISGFILDGYPRNKEQAQALAQFTKLTHAILIDISDQVAQERIVNRRMCSCGMTYHLMFKQPKKEGVCDECGEKIFQRGDDTKEALAKRLKIYHQETEPVYQQYEQQEIFHRVNGERLIEEVWEDVKKLVQL